MLIKRSPRGWTLVRQQQWLSTLEHDHTDLTFVVFDNTEDDENVANDENVAKKPVVVHAHLHLLRSLSPLIRRHVEELSCCCTGEYCAQKNNEVSIVLSEVSVSTVRQLLNLVYCGEVHVARHELRALDALMRDLGVDIDCATSIVNDDDDDDDETVDSDGTQGNEEESKVLNSNISPAIPSKDESVKENKTTPLLSNKEEQNEVVSDCVSNEVDEDDVYVDEEVNGSDSEPLGRFECGRCGHISPRARALCYHLIVHLRGQLITRLLKQMVNVEHWHKCFFCGQQIQSGMRTMLRHLVVRHEFGFDLMTREEQQLVKDVKSNERYHVESWKEGGQGDEPINSLEMVSDNNNESDNNEKNDKVEEGQCERCPRKFPTHLALSMHILAHLKEAVKERIVQGAQVPLEKLAECFICGIHFKLHQKNLAQSQLRHFAFVHQFGHEMMTERERAVFQAMLERQKKAQSNKQALKQKNNSESLAKKTRLGNNLTWSGCIKRHKCSRCESHVSHMKHHILAHLYEPIRKQIESMAKTGLHTLNKCPLCNTQFFRRFPFNAVRHVLIEHGIGAELLNTEELKFMGPLLRTSASKKFDGKAMGNGDKSDDEMNDFGEEETMDKEEETMDEGMNNFLEEAMDDVEASFDNQRAMDEETVNNEETVDNDGCTEDEVEPMSSTAPLEKMSSSEAFEDMDALLDNIIEDDDDDL